MAFCRQIPLPRADSQQEDTIVRQTQSKSKIRMIAVQSWLCFHREATGLNQPERHHDGPG
jgi:hypothetical protein